MLKRRASKRFVLAETGEQVAWDTTADNDRATTCTTPGGSTFRRDSEPAVELLPSLTVSLVSPSLPSTTSTTDTQNSSASTSPDVAINSVSLNSTIVDGSRLTTPGTAGTVLDSSGNLK